MRYLIFGFILLLLAIWLGLEMSRGAGYVLIAYRHWTLETSLWVAVVSLIIIFLVLYFIFRTIGRTTRISKNIRRWKRMRRLRKARQLTNQGLCELAEGDWQPAEQTLIKAAQITKSPLINYLAAARAAQAQQAYERRDDYLRKAHMTTKGSGIAVGLTQAQLQISSKQWEQALATLTHLNRTNPRHSYTLKLLEIVYQQLQDWEQLQKLLPSLRKYKVLSTHELDTLERKIYLALLAEANKKDTRTLIDTWKSLPRHWHQDIELIRAYTQYLIIHREDSTAISLIESVLKKKWDSTLVESYGLAQGESSAKQLSIAESWFKKYPKEPELLLCLGRLSIREKFWGKAKEYLEASIKLVPTADAYQELGAVLEATNEKEAALESYKLGLEHSHETQY
ncbi:heme biosynthesis protein HemY [Candidiatus Paracoxiella cheracis]|uniref:heme biosynthesis protein HemY n=1 Tax=Candidiatus Paracoxiella cheracis TaxID=3405120 RepID=UPI003BF5ACFD